MADPSVTTRVVPHQRDSKNPLHKILKYPILSFNFFTWSCTVPPNDNLGSTMGLTSQGRGSQQEYYPIHWSSGKLKLKHAKSRLRFWSTKSIYPLIALSRGIFLFMDTTNDWFLLDRDLGGMRRSWCVSATNKMYIFLNAIPRLNHHIRFKKSPSLDGRT